MVYRPPRYARATGPRRRRPRACCSCRNRCSRDRPATRPSPHGAGRDARGWRSLLQPSWPLLRDRYGSLPHHRQRSRSAQYSRVEPRIQGGKWNFPAARLVGCCGLIKSGQGRWGATSPMREGIRIYNLFPTLAGTVRDWMAHLPRIAGMGFNAVYINPFHYPGFSGSLYAVKDYYRLNPLFRADGPGDDELLLRQFTEAAGAHGLRVIMDLVINHTSKDSEL